MKRFHTSILFAFITLITGIAIAGSTALVGGSGGTSTVTMDCGSTAFIVGVTASGGQDGQFGSNLLRKIRFTCKPFTGTTPGTSTSQTPEASAAKQATLSLSSAAGNCTSAPVGNIRLRGGIFIDRVGEADCFDNQVVALNVGGFGGSDANLACPGGEALFKVVAKVGDAIDSLQGFCRSFTPPTLAQQIANTVTPKPSFSSPVKISVNSSKSLSFTITNATPSQTFSIGIDGETDALSGGTLNPPEYKLEVINPSGSVVASGSFSKVPASTVKSVKATINATGTWKLRITNQKQQLGQLNVVQFLAF